MDIENKVALVTGSTRGIGKAIAEMLCKNGAIVYLNSYNSSTEGFELRDELRNNGYRCSYINGNVSNADDVENIFNLIKKEQGRLEILINNAGVYLPDSVDIESYNLIHNVNSFGYYLCTVKASEVMKDFGKIINISSIWGIEPNVDSIIASGVKAEIEHYTKAFAKKFKGKIQVNSVAPGYTKTKLLTLSLSEDYIRNVILLTPINRLIEPCEIASTVLFLIQNDSITGQTIVVDGGYTL